MRSTLNPVIVSIADDLTGSNISAALLDQAGLSRVYVIQAKNLHDYPSDAQAIVINVETRDREYPQSLDLLEWVIDKLKTDLQTAGKSIYWNKRVDSTLRGYINEELKIIIDIVEPKLLLFAPAFPAAGRRTKNGYQVVDYQPVDPYFQNIDLNLVSHLTTLPFNSVIVLTLDEVRKNSLLNPVYAGNGSAIIADAENNHDLFLFAKQSFAKWQSGALSVCSGVYLGKLAEVGIESGLWESKTKPSPILMLIGSRSETTEQQILVLREAHYNLVLIDPKDATSLPETNTLLGADIILVFTNAQENHIDDDLESIALIGEILINTLPNSTIVVLSGGRTASHCLSKLGVTLIDVIGEISPLIILGKAKDGLLKGRPIITKGGLVGSESQLKQIVEHIHELYRCFQHI